jgi:inner membrane protein
MKGRMHLVLSGLSLLVITYPLWPYSSLLIWLGVYAGVLTGSLAPDVDAPDSVIFHLRMLPLPLRSLLSLFGYLFRYLIYVPLSFLFWMVLSRNYRHEHRGLLHTPLGVTAAAFFVLGYAGIISLLLTRSVGYDLLLYSGAFWAGCILHLVQDSCTPGGIAWAFPWNVRRLRGRIRTDSRWDPRPVIFAGILAGCLVFLALLPRLSSPSSWVVAFLSFIGAWYLFLFLAGSTQASS